MLGPPLALTHTTLIPLHCGCRLGTYVFCILIFHVFKWLPVDTTILPSTIRKIQMLSLLFTLNICAGNASLMYTTVSLREVLARSG